MRVHRTPRDRFFTVLGNEVLQDRRLSFTALGVLTYLLSLEDGTRNDVKTLADERPGPGRKAIAAALDELAALGYYVRVTARHEDGRIRTTTAIYDIPQKSAKPQVVSVPTQVGTGQPDIGASGTNPSKETPEKETFPPPPVEETATPAEAAVEAPKDRDGGESFSQDEIAACAPIVARIGREEPRLTIGFAEMGRVLPVIAEWRSRGASDEQIVRAATAWVPERVKTAAGFVAAMLRKKMPAPLPVADITPRLPMVECPGCKSPSRVRGLCSDCQPGNPGSPGVVEDSRHAIAAELRRRMGWQMAS
ncbi:hypothetical protein [Nonomuraea longicatena]|uniref:Helix-turn-helix domain-containing protein n=1 Tax=Nonomuraea longicatena TaxID=83682 RepID=A0ABN1RD30_9ACTN